MEDSFHRRRRRERASERKIASWKERERGGEEGRRRTRFIWNISRKEEEEERASERSKERLRPGKRERARAPESSSVKM